MLPIKSTNSPNVKMVGLVGQDRNFPSENRSSGAYTTRIEAVYIPSREDTHVLWVRERIKN